MYVHMKVQCLSIVLNYLLITFQLLDPTGVDPGIAKGGIQVNVKY